MKLEQLLFIFPIYLQEQTQDIPPDALQALDQILANLDEQPEEETRKRIIQWMKTHTQARDILIRFADKNRELSNVPRPPENAEATTRQNLLELQKIRKQQQEPPK
ncbi:MULTISPECIES: hypothetical protein [Spirulina sp. CCY15215]|uniref:hypothetical protein n=1 Tax=Spirulina sp. CCY15215 TaxID=2767591 RepID=UPI00194E2B2F|nr:hypothetical protein [Spirulina major]